MHTTSTTLLGRLRQPGDQEAWSRFAALYTPLMYYWARKAGLEQEDAADLVQDVFAILIREMPDFEYDRRKSFRGWLRTVTLNKWRERLRRRSLPAACPEEGSVAEVAVPDPAADFWETEYRQHLVRRALELARPRFPAETWQACWQLVVEGRPAREVAAELGTNLWAVYSAKSRVLRHLRQEIEGMLD
jgi:RNA polymerase sigma-70 factor (ECF subfamily)